MFNENHYYYIACGGTLVALLIHFFSVCVVYSVTVSLKMDVTLKRGPERVEVESLLVTTEMLRRTFRVKSEIIF